MAPTKANQAGEVWAAIMRKSSGWWFGTWLLWLSIYYIYIGNNDPGHEMKLDVEFWVEAILKLGNPKDSRPRQSVLQQTDCRKLQEKMAKTEMCKFHSLQLRKRALFITAVLVRPWAKLMHNIRAMFGRFQTSVMLKPQTWEDKCKAHVKLQAESFRNLEVLASASVAACAVLCSAIWKPALRAARKGCPALCWDLPIYIPMTDPFKCC